MHFTVSDGKLELKHSSNEQEIEFHSDDYVVKLNGTSIFSPYNENQHVLIKIEQKSKDYLVFNGMWIYADYLAQHK